VAVPLEALSPAEPWHPSTGQASGSNSAETFKTSRPAPSPRSTRSPAGP